ncbi:uncharacterized protein BO80DRAFT_101556 [Aspergillus ibericus CBS 121593]|uniref:Uncharacterized protein n=1 Tax=Aspergillus ibericus CBS 121593 TaxID=1448316 RepID=A0A395GZT0_9EURO|nr:hypothetical protein BO80DRAFT_101556 [Aspergillus ibericus CBS 121593]RAL00545.1 hypothetical protein BO80DRAFT_101556 [Aspergillus ibericus CBS 121593]
MNALCDWSRHRMVSLEQRKTAEENDSTVKRVRSGFVRGLQPASTESIVPSHHINLHWSRHPPGSSANSHCRWHGMAVGVVTSRVNTKEERVVEGVGRCIIWWWWWWWKNDPFLLPSTIPPFHSFQSVPSSHYTTNPSRRDKIPSLSLLVDRHTSLVVPTTSSM